MLNVEHQDKGVDSIVVLLITLGFATFFLPENLYRIKPS